jgi:MSHA biogenesis protein MshG
MKSFQYKALDNAGATVEGTFEGSSDYDLEQYFLKSNLTPLKVEASREGGEGFFHTFLESLRKKLLDTELIAFTRQFAAAYGAGMPVAATIELLAKQCVHQGFRKALLQITAKIQAGKGLTEAFLGYPRFFNSTYLAILSSGEVSGNLDVVLNYSAGLLEKKYLHQEKIKSTFLYPKLVLGMIGITIAVITVFVIPQFAKLYERFNAVLPLPTRLLLGFAVFVRTFWWLSLILVPAGLVLRH